MPDLSGWIVDLPPWPRPKADAGNREALKGQPTCPKRAGYKWVHTAEAGIFLPFGGTRGHFSFFIHIFFFFPAFLLASRWKKRYNDCQLVTDACDESII